MVNTSWEVIDLDLIPGNIKDTVDIFWVIGNYTGIWVDGIVPFHFVWNVTVWSWTYTFGNTSNWWCTQYWGCLWLRWCIYGGDPGPNWETYVYMIKLDLTTFVITQYTLHVFNGGSTTWSLTWTVVACHINAWAGYNTSFDLSSSVVRSAWVWGGAPLPGCTNSETVWWLTYETRFYVVNYATLGFPITIKSWFYVS